MGAGEAGLGIASATLAAAVVAATSLAEPARVARACSASACFSAGAGTLVREGPSGAREVRRPEVLRDADVDAMAAVGETVWLGLSALRGAERWPLGLVRYDWARGRAHAFRGTDAGPCGFFVHDLQVRDGTLWVATDLGLSRLGVAPDAWDEWAHFSRGEDGALEEVACAGLVADAMAADPALVPRYVAEFRPRYWRRVARHGTRHAGSRDGEARSR